MKNKKYLWMVALILIVGIGLSKWTSSTTENNEIQENKSYIENIRAENQFGGAYYNGDYNENVYKSFKKNLYQKFKNQAMNDDMLVNLMNCFDDSLTVAPMIDGGDNNLLIKTNVFAKDNILQINFLSNTEEVLSTNENVTEFSEEYIYYLSKFVADELGDNWKVAYTHDNELLVLTMGGTDIDSDQFIEAQAQKNQIIQDFFNNSILSTVSNFEMGMSSDGSTYNLVINEFNSNMVEGIKEFSGNLTEGFLSDEADGIFESGAKYFAGKLAGEFIGEMAEEPILENYLNESDAAQEIINFKEQLYEYYGNNTIRIYINYDDGYKLMAAF